VNVQTKLTAVVVDWDGTTVKSKKVYHGSMCKVFEVVGLAPPTLQTFSHEVARMGVMGFYRHYGILEHLALERITRIRDEYVDSHWHEITLRPDALELFTACAHTRVPLIVMSSNEAWVIEQKLADCRLSSCVRKIIATDDKETSLLELIAALKALPKSLLFVDDSGRDIRLAKRAGVSVAGFMGGYGSASDIREAKPDFFVDSLRGVAKLVTNHRDK
jgi:phosphoglycolate phosphatase-like HAD superfamily hydrolase